MNLNPISTAPRDGTQIVVGALLEGLIIMSRPAYWSGDRWKLADGYGYWTERDDCGPTHWSEQ